MELIFAALTAATGTIVGLKCVKPIALRLGLVDKPCARKQHDGHIPLVGRAGSNFKNYWNYLI